MNDRQTEWTVKDVWKARSRIQPLIEKTPLIFSEALSNKTGANVYLKLENMQHTGSFKIRGAANKLLSLSNEQKEKGVATFSTGNHGIAVASVAQQLGIEATVCISDRVPNEKVAKLKRLGANVKVIGHNQDDAEYYCNQLEKNEGITVIKPFDDLDVIAGQGTIALELIEQCPDMDQVVIPLSGGGLLSGIAFFLKQIDRSITITGVSMEHAAVMHESLKQGKPVVLKEKDTLADSLLGGIGSDNQYTYSMTKAAINHSYLVSETHIAAGMLFLMKQHKMIVEGAAATGIGWLLEQHVENENIVVIVSGNNIDLETVQYVLNSYHIDI